LKIGWITVALQRDKMMSGEGEAGNEIEYRNFDEETLRRVERNDPHICGLKISKEVDWIKGAGCIIGNSTTLRGINIHVDADDGIAKCWYQELFHGLSKNRSIESLQLIFDRDVVPTFDVFHLLSPFFENNSNLRSFRVSGSNQIQSLASTLSKCNKETCQLQSVQISYCPDSDEDIASLLNSLNGTHTLLELEISCSYLRKMGGVALAKLLNNDVSKIHKLEFDSSYLDENFITLLNSAMTMKNAVTSLSLSESEFTPASGRILSSFLCHPLCKLEKLCLTSTSINDEGVACLGEALATNGTLKYLDLSCNEFITSTGWKWFSKCLRSHHSVLEEIDLSVCVDEQCVFELVNALEGNSSLKRLVTAYTKITGAGWSCIFHTLLSFASSLEAIEIEEEVWYPTDIFWLEEIDWTVFSRGLCNDWSIETTHSSNHTFHTIVGHDGDTYDDCFPEEILPLLLMNRNGKNKVEVARQKILKYHFCEGNTNIHEFICMSLTSIPFAIEWIGRNNTELSLMYNVVRELPTLFDMHQAPLTKKQRY
jgi:hypothetical protein